MRRFIGLFQFQNEANLLDSKTYILKSFLAVATAYGLAVNNDIIRRDMISVLFGLMLTLEPVTLTGIRHGWHQMYATILGALSTAAIISIFGINIITISLSVAFTLYVCLKINWREVSPVAIFTSIYMTQYVQVTETGEPSILLTIQLRLMALGAGIIIAILFNLLFSFFSYGKMTNKRISFLFKSIVEHMEKTLDALKTNDFSGLEENQRGMSKSFNNIDWVYGFLRDMEEEKRIKNRIIGGSAEDMGNLIEIVMDLRSICHLNYDISLSLLRNEEERKLIHDNQGGMVERFQHITFRMRLLKEGFSMEDSRNFSRKNNIQQHEHGKNEHSRVLESLYEMEALTTLLEYRIGNLKRFD
ncbi:MAG: rane protein of unknown function [Anaerosolibacter sp.]|uniref:aromatic acid exporter family protein n=1 Tax=Anaerosolibacter sp. TaxID=1872527 RepID=UPI0026060D6E|nr:aromatic acid exporter family protein [Anaerosolibacter sp.]MDF2546019.1 rane protein of unknown function [Anaerosolibacter sp.]